MVQQEPPSSLPSWTRGDSERIWVVRTSEGPSGSGVTPSSCIDRPFSNTHSGGSYPLSCLGPQRHVSSRWSFWSRFQKYRTLFDWKGERTVRRPVHRFFVRSVSVPIFWMSVVRPMGSPPGTMIPTSTKDHGWVTRLYPSQTHTSHIYLYTYIFCFM